VRKLLPLLLVALIGAAQVGLYQARHRDEAALEALLEDGTAEERVYALHVLTNRGSTPHTQRQWNRAYVIELMNDPEPLVADFAFTVDVCRMAKPVWQEARLSTRLKNNFAGTNPKGETFTGWLRRFLLFRRKVAGRHMGTGMRLKNDEVRWLLSAIEGDTEALDPEVIFADIHQRQTRVNLARTKRMAPPKPEERGNRRNKKDTDKTDGGRLPGGGH